MENSQDRDTKIENASRNLFDRVAQVNRQMLDRWVADQKLFAPEPDPGGKFIMKEDVDKLERFMKFAEELKPGIHEQFEFYESYHTRPENLIGRKVVAISNGFSCSNSGGTKMTIDAINRTDPAEVWVHLMPNEDTSRDNYTSRGWSCKLSELHRRVKPY